MQEVELLVRTLSDHDGATLQQSNAMCLIV